jgi:hypothetical protein
MTQGFQNAIAQVMPTARLTGLFSSLATFYQPVKTQGPTGNYLGTYTAVSSMTNIPCMDAPESTGRLMATEVKTDPNVLSEWFRHVLLDRYYSFAGNAATPLGWQVDVDGTRYDLLGAESDSQRTQTRLRLQKVVVSRP